MDLNRGDVRGAGTELSTIAAVFDDHKKAEKAIGELTRAGFRDQQLGVAVCDSEGKEIDKDWVGRVRKMMGEAGEEPSGYSSMDTSQTLRNMGLEEQSIPELERAMDEGDILVTVRAINPARRDEARAILDKADAKMGPQIASARIPGAVATTPSREELRGREAGLPSGSERNIRLFGEVLRVHKEGVPKGEVRMHKEVITEHQKVDVPVEREELVIERRPGSRQPVAGSAQVGKDNEEIRIPVSEEKVRVEKKPVVNEEVRVSKRKIEEVEHVGGDVRHEELRVDNKENVDIKKPGDKDKKVA